MLRPTTTNLKKIESLFQELGYKIIYEKGHFQSGYCIVNTQNMIVVNKFYKTDARFNCLALILKDLDIAERQANLSEEALVVLSALELHKLEKE